MKTKYSIKLKEVERQELEQMTRRGKAPARRIKRAQILLLASEGRKDKAIIQALLISPATVFRIRRRFAEKGLEAALKEEARPGREKKLDGKQEAFLIATACSQPPEGRRVWTMQMLADKLVRLNLVDTISDETIRLILKKGGLNPGNISSGVFPR